MPPGHEKKALMSGTLVEKGRNGFQVSFTEITVEKFACEDWKNPFLPYQGYTSVPTGPLARPTKYKVSDGKITSVTIQQVLSSGYSAPHPLSSKPISDYDALHWEQVSFPGPVKMPPEGENNEGIFTVVFEGHRWVDASCLADSCIHEREQDVRVALIVKFALPSFTKQSALFRKMDFQVSETTYSLVGPCAIEVRFKARVNCKTRQTYVKDLFGPLSPGCVEYKFIPEPTSSSAIPKPTEPTTSAVTTTVMPTTDPEPTTSAVTTTVTPTKEPEPTISAVTTTVMTTKDPEPTTSAVTTTVTPTTSANSKGHFIQFCGDKKSKLKDHWIDFAIDKEFTSYIGATGTRLTNPVVSLPDLDQHKTFYMRTSTRSGGDHFGVAFRSGQCGNIQFSSSPRAMGRSRYLRYYSLKFNVTGLVPDGTALTFFIFEQRNVGGLYIDYACNSDVPVSCPSSIPMRPELSYFKIRDSESISNHYISMAAEEPVSLYLPITDTWMPEYVRWPDRVLLNDSVFYIGSNGNDKFTNIKNFQCGNVIASSVFNDKHLEVRWNGKLQKGVIFELVPLSYGTPLSYDIVCHIHEEASSAVTTTVTPTTTMETQNTAHYPSTSVVTTTTVRPTTSAVTTTVMPTETEVTTTVMPTTTAVTTTVMPTETEVTTTTMETQNTVHYPSTSEISEYEDFEEQSLSDEQLDEQTHQSGTKPVTPYSGVNEPAHMENLAKPSAHDISSHPFEKKQSSSSVLTISSVTLAVPLLSVVLMNPWF